MLNTKIEQKGNVSVKQKTVVESKAALKGTWFSLGILLAVILGTYILMFSIYMDRV